VSCFQELRQGMQLLEGWQTVKTLRFLFVFWCHFRYCCWIGMFWEALVLLNIAVSTEVYKIYQLTFSGKCYGGGHSAETYIARSCAFKFATCVMCNFENFYRNSPEMMMEDLPFRFLRILILVHLYGVSWMRSVKISSDTTTVLICYITEGHKFHVQCYSEHVLAEVDNCSDLPLEYPGSCVLSHYVIPSALRMTDCGTLTCTTGRSVAWFNVSVVVYMRYSLLRNFMQHR
jgi:hypothetical protein